MDSKNKLFKYFHYFVCLYIFSLPGLTGCSLVPTSNQVTPELSLVKKYVRQTTESSILRYRKINRAKPLVYGSMLIVSNSHDGVTAFDIDSGKKIWHFFVSNGVEKEPVVFKDNLYFGGNDGYFYSIKANNGLENWKNHVKTEIVASPAFDSTEGKIYFLTISNSLFALDAENGKQIWTYTRQDPAISSIRGGTTPLIQGHLVYVGFSEGSFVAFNKSNGTINWEIQLNKNKRFKDIDSTAVLNDGKIYVSGYDDKLYCLSSNNGEILWKFENGGYGSVTIKDNVLFYPTTSGKVFALNKDNSKKLWEIENINGIPTEISLMKDMIVFGESQGKVIFVNPITGKIIQSFEPGRGVLGGVQVNNSKSQVYFISGEANLYVMDVKWKSKNLFSFVD